MTVDQYAFWRAALEGHFLYPMQDGRFECGFWKTKNRRGTFSGVAIWKDGDAFRILVDGKLIDPEKFAQRWNFTWQSPVTKEAYDEHQATGLWPGEVHGIGHNAPDDFTELKENIEGQTEQVLKWLKGLGKLTSDRDADKAANYRDSLNKLWKKADDRRKQEKQPLADRVKKIDAKYGAIVKTAKDAADHIRSVLTIFMQEKEEKEKKRIEEERKRQEEERRALEDQDIVLAALQPDLPPVEELQAKPIRVGGQLGRATGLRTVKTAQIEDLEQVFHHFKENDKVVKVLQTLANQAIRSGLDVPGAKLKEEKAAS